MPPDLSDMRAFLTSPLPRNVGVLQCYIRRNKSGTNKLFPIYSLYLKVVHAFVSCCAKPFFDSSNCMRVLHWFQWLDLMHCLF